MGGKARSGLPKGTVFHPCACAAREYWNIRAEGNGFDQYRAMADRNRHEVLSFEEDADGYIKRVSRVISNENPLPASMRKMLGMGNDFSFRITEVRCRLSSCVWVPVVPSTLSPPAADR